MQRRAELLVRDARGLALLLLLLLVVVMMVMRRLLLLLGQLVAGSRLVHHGWSRFTTRGRPRVVRGRVSAVLRMWHGVLRRRPHKLCACRSVGMLLLLVLVRRRRWGSVIRRGAAMLRRLWR